MKSIPLIILIASCQVAFSQSHNDGEINFTSSDSVLENGFKWARLQAMRYVRRGNDPVGHWYEAALPEREAFCMRDVAHQLSGANLLGLSDINKNLLAHFVKSISASRDWCGYWEIDKFNRPAPVDYRSDDDFWYNLPGNFDILNACFRQYQWTGDTTFLYDKAFVNFYSRTCNDYVNRWDTDSDGIMEGTRSVEKHDRGIGSYDESLTGITGNDLIAAQFIGYSSYSAILRVTGNELDAGFYIDRSKKLRDEFDKRWWDGENQSYHHFLTKDGWLHNDVMQLFLLRWDFIPSNRIQPVLKSILVQEGKLNVEMRSYFAREMFRYGDAAEARRLLKSTIDPTLERREYPEVSFGALEAYAEGLMGIDVRMDSHSVRTLSRVKSDENAKLENIPLVDGTFSIEHHGQHESIFVNNTSREILWWACVTGKAKRMFINGKSAKTQELLDAGQRIVTYAVVKIPRGKSCRVKVMP
ncbi:hypothetical protein BH10BAC4_BH10BAC4_26060 [soil metagenome]